MKIAPSRHPQYRCAALRNWWGLVGVIFCGQVAAAIDIEGIDGDLAKAIIEQSPLQGADCHAPDWWLDKQLEATKTLAAQALETQGFYLPSIQTRLNHDNTCWQARLNIEPGSKATIRTVALTGLHFLSNTDGIDNTPTEGQPFTHADYESFKSNITDLAYNKGYLEGRWETHLVTITLPTSMPEGPTQENAVYADIKMDFDPGEQFFIGPISLNLGNIDDDFINKFHDLHRGQAFVREELDTAYRYLNATGYFRTLSILPLYNEIDGLEVPLQINGELSHKRTYEVGAGYATDSGPRARGEINWRRINSRGDRARIAAMQATHNSEFSVEYRKADGDDPRNRWISYIAAYEYDQPDTYRREKTSLTANEYHRTDKAWTRNNAIQYSSEVWRIGNTLGDTQLISLGQGYQRNEGTGKGRLNSGLSYSANWRAAAEALGSDINVAQIQLGTKRIDSLGNKWRLLTRAKIGVDLLGDFDLLPPDLRFYAGGDNSVRGYDLDTLGETEVVDDTLVVLGGKRLIEGSIEFDYPIKKDWSAAVFFDAGSAFNTTPDIHKGAGFGARWYSPLGPIKIDIARGMDGINPGWRLHISFGAEL